MLGWRLGVIDGVGKAVASLSPTLSHSLSLSFSLSHPLCLTHSHSLSLSLSHTLSLRAGTENDEAFKLFNGNEVPPYWAFDGQSLTIKTYPIRGTACGWLGPGRVGVGSGVF